MYRSLSAQRLSERTVFYVPGYGHSLSDVKEILQKSLHLCMLIRSEDYLELVSRCVTDLEVSRFKVQVFALFVFNASDDL
jgi:hypothetical protein